MTKSIARRLVEWQDTAIGQRPSERWMDLIAAARAEVAAEMSDDARDAMSLPPRDRGRRIGVQVGRWFVGMTQ